MNSLENREFSVFDLMWFRGFIFFQFVQCGRPINLTYVMTWALSDLDLPFSIEVSISAVQVFQAAVPNRRYPVDDQGYRGSSGSGLPTRF